MLIIQDSALGKYTIGVTYKSYTVRDGNKELNTFPDFNQALKNIASRLVADTNGFFTLAQFAALEAATYQNIKYAVEFSGMMTSEDTSTPVTEEKKEEENVTESASN